VAVLRHRRAFSDDQNCSFHCSDSFGGACCRPLATSSGKLSEAARQRVVSLGVNVQAIDEDGVVIGDERIQAKTVVRTAGVAPSLPSPGVAQVAMQQGKYAALSIFRKVIGHPPSPPFRYFDKGNPCRCWQEFRSAAERRHSVQWIYRLARVVSRPHSILTKSGLRFSVCGRGSGTRIPENVAIDSAVSLALKRDKRKDSYCGRYADPSARH
jgi:hypothetical protein